MSDDAKLIAVFGLFAGIVAIGNGGAPSRSKSIVNAILAALIGLIGVYDYSQVSDRVKDVTIGGTQIASVGWGLYAVLAGAGSLLVSILIGHVRK